MAKKEAGGDNVVGIGSLTCCVDKCKGKNERMNFCSEHYMWFKEGLINKKGVRPSDFDKKYQAFMMKNKKAA